MTMKSLGNVYDILYKRYGPQGWWPGDTQFEVIVGAILTQNTAWSNVEKAIANLRRSGALRTPKAMAAKSMGDLAKLIRPAGYYNVKSLRLLNFLGFLERECGMSIRRLSADGTASLRKRLLSVNGIGPETCDSILLYAFGRPVFVVDAYTRRIFSRHGLFGEGASYEHMQKVFTDALRRDARLFNEYHALIVRVGKELCRTRPRCGECPLKGLKMGYGRCR
jgi:endonuclease-3 related protein